MKGHAVGLAAFGIFFIILMLHAPGLDFYLASPDHGHQLSLGRQIMLGKFPFIDLFFKYGPLTALTSALGIWTWDCLIPETILCAAGYAATLAMVFCLIRHYTSSITGSLGAIAGLALLARFYKWYYWLFPVLALYCMHRWLQAKDGRIGWILVGGFVGGVGALYRFDLGLACLGFLVLFGALISVQPFRPRQAVLYGIYSLLGWATPMGLWLIALIHYGGIGAAPDYLSATYSGALGSLAGMALPVPIFDWNDPWSDRSRAALAFLLLPSAYIAAMAYGFHHHWKAGASDAPRYRFLVGAGVMGLGLFPQALHRADVLHLIQVLPPFLIVASLLVWDLVQIKGSLGQTRWRRTARLSAAAGFVVALSVTFLAILPYGGIDLESTQSTVVKRYQGLAAGCQGDGEHPICELLSSIRNNSASHDPILVADAACQVNYFSRRPLSGFLIGFDPAYFDGDCWRIRELKAVQSNPPALVIASDGFLTYGPGHWFRVSYPELYEFLAKHYRAEVKKAGTFVLLGRSADSVTLISDSERAPGANRRESFRELCNEMH